MWIKIKKEGDVMHKRGMGQIYEAHAIEYLEKNEFKLIGKNFYSPYGEVDLVMSKEDTLHFIEVKYRSNNHFGSPRASITPIKLKRLKLTAIHYLKTQACGWVAFKVGFIGITKENEKLQFDYIENIFD